MRVILSEEPRVHAWQNEFGDWIFESGVRRIKLSNLERAKSDELNALIEVQSGSMHIYQSRLNLLSASQQETLTRTLKRRDGFGGWESIIHLCFLHAVKSERKLSEPILLDVLSTDSDPSIHAIEPILLADTTTVLAGDGGVGKSYFALGLAATIVSGQELISGLKPRRMGTVLYLDYEDSPAELGYRWNQLKRGLSTMGSGLYYQRMTQPIQLVKNELDRQVRHYEPELIIVDSFSMACGGEPEKADSAVRVFDVLRTLGRTALIITHVAKAEQGLKRPNPYGSIHVVTQARSVLIQKRTEDGSDNEIVFTIANTKNNRGRAGNVLGFRLQFEPDCVRLRRLHSSDPVLLDGMTLTEQIRVLLRQPTSVSDLAEQTGANQSSIRAILNRLKAQNRVIKTDDRWSLIERA